MIQQIETQELARKLAAGDPVTLLDVRQPWEHEQAALDNSQLIPLDELSFRAEELKAPAGTLIVVYCHHGIRSLSGAALLGHLGFENVASLRGGIDAWSQYVDASVPRY